METNLRLEYAISTLVRFRKLWIIPAVAGLVLSLLYVFFVRSETWTARQTLIVRDDMLGQSLKPGQFSSLESMKSAQETILEIARRPEVIRSVLTTLGPKSKGLFFNASRYPDAATIEDVQGLISLSAPNGAEFGKTEVMTLNAKSSSPERSQRFIELLLEEMEKNINEVRMSRLQSMESELLLARNGARAALELSMEKLRVMEDTLGADIGTMNGLNSAQPGDTFAKSEISQILVEQRAAQVQLDSALSAQQQLNEAKLNPERVFTTSANFLQTEPKLQALSKSLVDAQKAYADNTGRFEDLHPAVRSSRETVRVMREQIFQELESLSLSLNSQITELQQRIARLDGLADQHRARLVELGSKRVDHLAVNGEFIKKSEVFNQFESRLSEVRSLRASTGNVAWLTRIGAPQLATRPDGMGKKSLVLVGGFCGLMMGLGLIMLVAPPLDVLPAAVGVAEPTASIKQSISAATSSALDKGVSLAKSLVGKLKRPQPDQRPSDPVMIPDVSNFQSLSPWDHLSASIGEPKLKPTAALKVDPLESIWQKNPHRFEKLLPAKERAAQPEPESQVSTAHAAESVPVESQTVAEIEPVEIDPLPIANSLLDELRAHRAKQTAPKIGKGDTTTQIPTGDTPRRPTPLRPFDLAKSADHFGSPVTGFELVSSEQGTDRSQTDGSFTAVRKSVEIAQDAPTSALLVTEQALEVAAITKALGESLGNPFLKNRHGSTPATPTTPVAELVDEITLIPTTSKLPLTPIQVRSATPSVPIPDQIKSLAESIASLAQPVKRQ